jgi:hypothetical protein
VLLASDAALFTALTGLFRAADEALDVTAMQAIELDIGFSYRRLVRVIWRRNARLERHAEKELCFPLLILPFLSMGINSRLTGLSVCRYSGSSAEDPSHGRSFDGCSPIHPALEGEASAVA